MKTEWGHWRCILCESVGSKIKVVRAQADRNVIFDVLMNPFFKALPYNSSECHRVPLRLEENFTSIPHLQGTHLPILTNNSQTYTHNLNPCHSGLFPFHSFMHMVK